MADYLCQVKRRAIAMLGLVLNVERFITACSIMTIAQYAKSRRALILFQGGINGFNARTDR
jgi:hypothetical protein